MPAVVLTQIAYRTCLLNYKRACSYIASTHHTRIHRQRSRPSTNCHTIGVHHCRKTTNTVTTHHQKRSMTNLEALLQRHSIEAVCAADRAQGKSHILINVGCNSRGRAVPSLERLKRKVEKCIVMNKKHVFATTKLYIIGDWINAEPDEVQDEVRRCSTGIRQEFMLTYTAEAKDTKTAKRSGDEKDAHH